MYYSEEVEKKERRRIIAVATISIVVILALIVAIIVVATKKSTSNNYGDNSNGSVLLDENGDIKSSDNKDGNDAGQVGEAKPVEEKSDSNEDAGSKAEAPVATSSSTARPQTSTTASSSDIPTTGPEDALPLAILLGMATTYGISTILAKREA